MLKVPVKDIVRSILQIKQDIVINNSRASRSTTTQLILELDGDFSLQPYQQVRFRPRTGSSTTIGSRIQVGIFDDQPGLSSELFVEKSFNKIYTWEPVAEVISKLLFFLVQMVVFRLPETFNSLATDGGVNRYTLARHI